jgi:hypothetical protein
MAIIAIAITSSISVIARRKPIFLLGVFIFFRASGFAFGSALTS